MILIRMFTAGVKVVELDNTGRLLLPKDLQIFQELLRTMVLSSSGNMIEIWNKKSYEQVINNDNIDFGFPC